MDKQNERAFLHDIANPLGTAIFVADAFLEEFRGRKDASPDELKMLNQLFTALNEMKKRLEDRRNFLIKQGVPSALS